MKPHGTPIHLHDEVVGWRRKERKAWVAWGSDGKYLGRHRKPHEATLAVVNHAEETSPERKQ